MRDNPPFILLYSGVSLISGAIRWQTRSEYSHAAISDGKAVWESIEGEGVRCRQVDERDSDAVTAWLTVPAYWEGDDKEFYAWLNS